MKRSLKATLAGGAAIILLAGGAGTFARWYDTSEVGQTTITTGQLSLFTGAGMWRINTATDPQVSQPFTPATDKIVPGDVLTYTTTATPTIIGKNLVAELTASMDGTGLEDLISPQPQPGKIHYTAVVTNDQGAPVTTLTEQDSGKTYNVTLTLTFPEYTNTTEASAAGSNTPDATWYGQLMQDKTINLNALKVTVAQTNR